MSQIKTHSANGRNYMIVQVPKDAKSIRLQADKELLYELYGWKGWNTQKKTFPPGKYALLFIAEEATEEQAANAVQHFSGEMDGIEGYKEYDPQTVSDLEDDDWRTYEDHAPYVEAIHSLNSLIRSLFPKWEECKHVILQEQ